MYLSTVCGTCFIIQGIAYLVSILKIIEYFIYHDSAIMDLDVGDNVFQRTRPEYNTLDLNWSVLGTGTCSLSVSRGVG